MTGFDVATYMAKWGLHDIRDGYENARKCIELLQSDTHYATACMLQYVIDGVAGCFVLSSTTQSTWQQYDNNVMSLTAMVVTEAMR